MHKIAFLLIACLLLPDAYIYLAHIVRNTRNRMLRFAWWLPTLLLLAAYVRYMPLGGDNPLAQHTQAIGWLAIGIFLTAVPKMVFMIGSLIGFAIHGLIRRCPRIPFMILGGTVAIVCFGCILYGTMAGITRFEVKEVNFYSDRLPKGFDGYRIVQISDLHTGSWQNKPQAIERLVEMVNAQQADLILFTGDLVNQQSHELDRFVEILSRLHAPDGVYSILGNHDYGDYYHWKNSQEKAADLERLKQQQQHMGWQMLNNAHTLLYHRGDSIALIGVENEGEPPFPRYADLPGAMKGTEGMFRILMSHNPIHWRSEVLPQTDIDLTLSGHTHAMQLELFGHSPSSWKYPEWAGMYTEEGQSLYVNVGIGYVGLPFRFGAWPEVTVFTLHE